MIHHRGGGGIQRHVSELASLLRDAGIRPVEVYPSADLIVWEDRGFDDQETWLRRTGADHKTIVEILETLAPSHAHVHSMMGLPDRLLEALSGLRVAYDWTMHDYYAVCPRAHLNRADHAYCGAPDEAGCDACLSRLGDYRGLGVVGPISAWRRRHARDLALARRVFVPSVDVRSRISRYMPELDFTLRPHPEVPSDPGILAAPPRPGARLRIAVLGNIVGTKGSRMLLACARHARSMNLPLEFVVLGRTDRDASFARLGNVRVTGPYPESEIYRRLAAAECQLAFLPSLVPETFMYALSIAMAARIYTICFDLGAQAERLKAWGWGRLLPADAGPESVNQALLDSLHLLNQTPPPGPAVASYPHILSDYYEFLPEEIAALRSGLRRAPTEAPQPQFDRRSHYARLH
jgi:hypothetical protein